MTLSHIWLGLLWMSECNCHFRFTFQWEKSSRKPCTLQGLLRWWCRPHAAPWSTADSPSLLETPISYILNILSQWFFSHLGKTMLHHVIQLISTEQVKSSIIVLIYSSNASWAKPYWTMMLATPGCGLTINGMHRSENIQAFPQLGASPGGPGLPLAQCLLLFHEFQQRCIAVQAANALIS